MVVDSVQCPFMSLFNESVVRALENDDGEGLKWYSTGNFIITSFVRMINY